MFYLIGLGGAGSRIADRFYKRGAVGYIISRISGREEEQFVGIAADTSKKIMHLKNIPKKNLVLIGRSRAKGHGTGGDIKKGKKIIEEECSLVLNALRKVTVKRPEGLFVIAGLGGGTGTGGCKGLAKRLKKAYKMPVIGMFILPSKVEGRHYLKNASEGITEAVEGVDGAVIFDTGVLTTRGEDVPGAHKIIDEAIFNILGAADEKVMKNLVGGTSAAGFVRICAEQVLAKDVLAGMLKERIYLKLDLKDVEKIVMFAKGDTSMLYGREVAEKWCEKRFGLGIEYVLQEVEGAKDLKIVTIIKGIKDIKKMLDEIESDIKEEKRSGFEDLLEDINPVL